MKIGYELTIEQTQKLAMTPELIQAIRILQFNNQELNEYIGNELLENPVLESEKADDDRVIDIDALRDKIIENNYDLESYKQWEGASSPEDDYSFEQYVAFRYSLVEHLLIQLQFSGLGEDDAKIGRYIIEGIDDNGYLTMSADEIAKTMRCDADTVERVLDVIQTFEPTGVGARDLKECIKIQLAAMGELTENFEYIIENMLEELAGNKIAFIAKQLGIKTQEAQAMADLIKKLEPKPGRGYDSDQTVKYVIPDICVEKINDEYVVTTNDSGTPRLMISSYYNRLASEAKGNDELSKYLNNRFNSAIWLMKSIEQRKKTIYNVASVIVSY